MSTEQEPARDFLQEALAILKIKGQSRLIPTIDHLRAVAADAARLDIEANRLSNIIMAMMRDNNLASLPVPVGALQACVGHHIDVERFVDGSVVVHLYGPTPADKVN